MFTVKITYEEFLKIKESGYSGEMIKHYACKYLKCKAEDIEDIDWNYKLTFDVYLKEPDEELVDDSLPY